MSEQRWLRVQELYHAALEHDADERSAFLERACSSDDVRREVESLLGYEGREHDILNKPAWPPEATVSDMAPALGVGRVLGSYQIVERLGFGGMGEVYRARDLRLNREVAIKVLPEALARNPERMTRFALEAQVLASMNHPNIAAIYGLEESDGVRALVMELVEGPTLADRIARGAIPVEEGLPLARQISEALEYAHDKGIVHRDLKPTNIKVTPEGTAKVLDFGLAKVMEEPHSPPVAHTTLAGVILGTAAYMSPEQARGKPVDRRADIWAFGAVVYEMLTARPPFGGGTTSDMLAQVITKEPDWEALPKGTPARIRRLLERCLRKDPKTRLQAIGEARIAMDEEESEPAGVAPSGHRRYLSWAVAALFGIATAVLAAGWWRSTRPPMRPLMRLSVSLGADVMLPSNRVGGLLALSPDGARLAVVARGGDGKQRLAVRLLAENHWTSLAGSEEATSPFFSPDGQSIAFFTGNKLKRIPVSGGAPVTLCDALDARGGSWGDDGNIILALTNSGLLRIPAHGGTPVPLTQLNRENREVTHRWPQVLPGSRAVVYTAHTHHGNYDDASIEVVSLDTGPRKMLRRGGFQPRYLASGHLAFVQQNTLFAAPFDPDRLAFTGEPVPIVEDATSSSLGASFDVSRTGTLAYFSSAATQSGSSIFWLDSSGATQPLQPSPGRYSDPFFSPDGKHLAFSLNNGGGSDIWVRDLEHDSASRRSFLAGRNFSPVWSPDGKYIVFSSSNPAAPGIYWVRADGAGGAERLTDGTLAEWPVSFTPDGRKLALTGEGANVEILVAAVEGDLDHLRLSKLEPFSPARFIMASPKLSPDGRWVAYISNETGPNELYVRPFPGPGGNWQISTGGGRYPVWSRNGHELFFQSSDRRIMVLNYTAKAGSFLAGPPRVWSERHLLDLDTSYNYNLSPDGKRFAVVLASRESAGQAHDNQITLLLNFFDELRRRAPVSR